MTSALRGVSQSQTTLREVAWIYYYGSGPKADKGEEVQNPENFADVLYVWSLRGKVVGYLRLFFRA